MYIKFQQKGGREEQAKFSVFKGWLVSYGISIRTNSMQL